MTFRQLFLFRSLVLLAGGAVLAECSESDQQVTFQPRRLLRDLSAAHWTVASAWHDEVLSPSDPERSLRPRWTESFEGARSQWVDVDSAAQFNLAGDWEHGAAAIRSGENGSYLGFGPGFAAACRAFPVSPLSNYVLKLWIQRPENEIFGLVLGTFNVAPKRLQNSADLTATWLDSSRHARKPLIFGPEEFAAETPGLRLLASRDDGFEHWRVEFSTSFFARSSVIGLLSAGNEAGAAFDDLELYELPARSSLAWSNGNFPSLPDDRAAVDLKRRTALVRRDGESRHALLTTPESQIRCRFPAPPGAVQIQLGATILAEDRLLRDGQHRETIAFRVGPEGAPWVHEEQRTLTLDAVTPYFWSDLKAPLDGTKAADWILELEVFGNDQDNAALIAFSEPILLYEPQDRAPERYNVVLISLDTMRADRLGRIVNGRSLTPNLDSLAKDAIVFPNALANASYTLPSHVSMFASQQPFEHGMLHPSRIFEPEKSALLTETLAGAGYVTAAFTAGAMLNPEFAAIYRGFDRYGELDPLLTETDPVPQSIPRWDAPQYNENLFQNYRLGNRVLPWIVEHAEQPFFLFLHSYLIHNYHPGEELKEAFAVRPDLAELPEQAVPPVWEREFSAATIARTNPASPVDLRNGAERILEYGCIPHRDVPYLESMYDATVFRADQEIGRILELLEELGIWERTIVMVVSDHGEEFLEHGGLSHAKTLYDEVLRIPWIMRVPGVRPRQIEEPVTLVDLAPSLLPVLELPVDPRMRGQDLLQATPAVTLHEGVESSAVVAKAARTSRAKVIYTAPGNSRPPERALSQSADQTLRASGYLTGDHEVAAAAIERFNLIRDPGEQEPLTEDDVPPEWIKDFRRLVLYLQKEP